MMYVYTNGEWQIAPPYVYTNNASTIQPPNTFKQIRSAWIWIGGRWQVVVLNPPTIRRQPVRTARVAVGRVFTIQCHVHFMDSPAAFNRQQWFGNGVPIAGATDRFLDVSSDRATTITYRCINTNAAGRTTSTDSVITFFDPFPTKLIPQIGTVIDLQGRRRRNQAGYSSTASTGVFGAFNSPTFRGRRIREFYVGPGARVNSAVIRFSNSDNFPRSFTVNIDGLGIFTYNRRDNTDFYLPEIADSDRIRAFIDARIGQEIQMLITANA